MIKEFTFTCTLTSSCVKPQAIEYIGPSDLSDMIITLNNNTLNISGVVWEAICIDTGLCGSDMANTFFIDEQRVPVNGSISGVIGTIATPLNNNKTSYAINESLGTIDVETTIQININ